MNLRTCAIALLLFTAACTGDDREDSPQDATPMRPDGGTERDAGSDPRDAGTSARDGGGPRLTWVPPAVELDADTIARAAVLFATCLPDDGLDGPLYRLYFEAYRDPFDLYDATAFECLAAATDGCAALERCTGLRFDTMGPCAPSCDGGRLTVCDDSWRFSADCSLFGLVCDANEAACVRGAGASCNPNTYEAMCVDGAPRGCLDGLEWDAYTCADYGLACASNEFSVTCRGTGGACRSSIVSTFGVNYDGIECTDATTLSACVNEGLHAIDCADIHADFTCLTYGDFPFCGLAAECDPRSNDAVTCDGDVLVFCNAGRTTRVDCTALGFTGCSTGPGRDGAYCSPSPWLP